MNFRLGAASILALSLAAGAVAIAQDTPAAPPPAAEVPPATPATPAPDATTPAPADPNAAPPPAADAPVPIAERPIDEIFRLRCRTCHSDEGTGSGPTLKGVYKRKLAAIETFNYSAAMKVKGGVWDDAALNSYLERPTAYIPGTKMFTASRDPDQRAKLIEYIKTY